MFWLALRRVQGVGPRTCRLLLEHFERAEKIFTSSASDLSQAGIAHKVAKAIATFRDFDSVERELCELQRCNARILRWTDADYPPNLRQIPDPPPCFFARGDAPIGDSRCIAVVGARAASDAGLRMAERLGLELAAKGFTVVSGLARGIDGAAHRGALAAGGRTFAVMGCGIDVVYPPEHRTLADSILNEGGALISELPVGTQPLAENFPSRNRILSGLCLGVVIVEAAEHSGSLITARMALDQNRAVFAVPGSPLSGKARGSNRLLKDGAILVECVEDMLEELAPQLNHGSPPCVSTTDQSTGIQNIQAQEVVTTPKRPVVAPIKGLDNNIQTEAEAIINIFKDNEALHVDAIIENSGLGAQTVLRLLLEMELHGIVAQHPGKRFSLAHPA